MNFDKSNNNNMESELVPSMEALSVNKSSRRSRRGRNGYVPIGRLVNGNWQQIYPPWYRRRANFRGGNATSRRTRASPRNQYVVFERSRNFFRFRGRGGQRSGRGQNNRRASETKSKTSSKGQGSNANNRLNTNTEESQQQVAANKDEKLIGENVGSFKCRLCNMKFNSFMGLFQHNRKTHSFRRKEFICRYCRISFKTPRAITSHLRSQHASKENELACENDTAPTQIPEKTERIPDDVQLFYCDFCPFAFKTAVEASRHKTRCPVSQATDIQFTFEYPGNEKYIISCICCGRFVNARYKLSKHLEECHHFVNVTAVYNCSVCGFSSKDLTEMNEHYNAHPKEEREKPGEKKPLRFPTWPVQRKKRRVNRLKNDVLQVLNNIINFITHSPDN